MSKPYGMTSMFQVVRPSQVEDAFYEAVCKAIDCGWTPEDAVKELRHDWDIRLEEKRREDSESFRRLARNG